MAICSCCGKPLEDAKFMLLNNVAYKSCPDCSKTSGEHVFYKCPDNFGATVKRSTSNNPMGLQSHCSPCRSNKKGPHEGAFLCSAVKGSAGYIINEIRFVPMGKQVFSTKEQVLEFLTETMPDRGCTYYYPSRKIDCEKGTLMLFQYGGELLGYAVHRDTVELSQPQVIDGISYSGYYQLEPDSITIFNRAITSDDFAKIDPTFNGFSQSARKMSPGLLPAVMQFIKDGNITYTTVAKTSVIIPEEVDETDIHIKEGAKKQITVNAYERNPQARNRCIKHYKKLNNGRLRCEICGFDFGKVYGDEFADKIHIHHLVEIHTIGEEYEVDAIKDLIPICPNCHMIAHSKKPAYTPDEIKEMIAKEN